MNPIKAFSLSLGISTALVASAESVATDPVGALSVQLRGGTVSEGTDNIISVPLSQSPVFSGKIKDKPTASSMQVHGNPGWEIDQFISSGPHFVLIGSGDMEGAYFVIESIVGDTITLDLNGESLATVSAHADSELSDILYIFPFWTPTSLFGDRLPNGTEVLLFGNETGINKSAKSILAYRSGSGGASGSWTFGGFGNAGKVAIHPYESFVVRMPPGSMDMQMVLTGSVPMSRHRLLFVNDSEDGQLKQTDYRVAYYSPLDVAVSDIGIGFAAGDQILVFDKSSRGENKSAATILSYSAAGDWTFGGFGDANEFVIEAGSGFVFRRSGSGPGEVVWANLQPYLR